MRVVTGLDALAEYGAALRSAAGVEARSVVSVGVFDGVHLGHLRLLHELVEMASELGGTPTVVTFQSHPDELLKGTAPPQILSLSYRLRLLRRAGVQRVVVLTFDEVVREMTPEVFAERVLVDGLATCGLLCGFDSAMGKDRTGTPAKFGEIGKESGFEVREGSVFLVDGEAVSSTRIRTAVLAGDLDLANRLLGRWPSALGEVSRGDGRGKELGFPTANVHPGTQILPPPGVYAVEVLVSGEQHRGVANLGTRPTFEPEREEPLLEVHLFDVPEGLDLYGASLEVGFVAHLRDEQRFGTVEELKAQIGEDKTAARAVFAR